MTQTRPKTDQQLKHNTLAALCKNGTNNASKERQNSLVDVDNVDAGDAHLNSKTVFECSHDSGLHSPVAI